MGNTNRGKGRKTANDEQLYNTSQIAGEATETKYYFF